MEKLWEQVAGRLSNPEGLFGLPVWLLGLFIVLPVVIVAVYLVRRPVVKLEESQNKTPSPATQARPSPPAAVTVPRESTVPDEVAVAVALSSVPDEVGVAVALALSSVPDEVGIAVTLALAEAVEEGVSAPPLLALPTGPAPWGEPVSAWRLLSRQQALWRKTSLTRDITPRGT